MNDVGISLSGFPPAPPPIVEISPPDIARRRLANWGAVQADAVKLPGARHSNTAFRLDDICLWSRRTT